MKKIETYKDLVEEKRLTKKRIAELELLIKEDMEDIKTSLNPLNLAHGAVRNIVSSRRNGVVGETIGITVDTLIKKILLRNSNWALKLATSFFLKNYAKNMVTKNADNIWHWLI